QAILTALASVSQAGSSTIDKYIVSKQKISFKVYLIVSFFLIALFALPFFIFFGNIKPEASQPFWIFLLLIGVVITTAVNIVYYSILRHEKLSEIEPILLLAPLFTVILTSLILKEERNFLIIILAIISSISLVWAHVRKEHFSLHKLLIPLLILSIFISPINAIISKKLLTVYDPFSFEFIRTSLALFILFIILKPSFKSLKKKSPKYLIYTNILTTFAWIIVYFSYIKIGIIQTVLIMNLMPMLVYVFAWIFLKEKIYWKNIVAMLIILACVTIAQVYPLTN
ncbi:MAG: DMT family transporter, partial [Nanoarchaeota archaeon]